MRAGSLFLFGVFPMSLILLIGCGDGGDSDIPDTGCMIGFAIDKPSYEDIWDTQTSSVDLGGPVETPGGIFFSSDCAIGDPGYDITWYNARNGASGSGGAWTGQRNGFFGPFCDTEWVAYNIPLDVGDNHITLTVRNAQGCTGQDSILIRRSPEESVEKKLPDNF